MASQALRMSPSTSRLDSVIMNKVVSVAQGPATGRQVAVRQSAPVMVGGLCMPLMDTFSVQMTGKVWKMNHCSRPPWQQSV